MTQICVALLSHLLFVVFNRCPKCLNVDAATDSFNQLPLQWAIEKNSEQNNPKTSLKKKKDEDDKNIATIGFCFCEEKKKRRQRKRKRKH